MVFLYASPLGVVHRERLQPPVEVAQKQARYLAAAQPINRQEQQDGFRNLLKLVRSPADLIWIRLLSMRGDERVQDSMFSYLTLEQRVPSDHPYARFAP